VVHDFEVVRQVPLFVVDLFHRRKASIVMRIVLRLFFDEHRAVHINGRIHLSTMTMTMKNIAVHQVQPMLMLPMLIQNKYGRHYVNSFRILLQQNVIETIAWVSPMEIHRRNIACSNIRISAEAIQLRRINKELEDNLIRTEQRFSQLQKTLMSFEEGTLIDNKRCHGFLHH
jgi:hypothetical protein